MQQQAMYTMSAAPMPITMPAAYTSSGEPVLIPAKLCNLPPFHPVASKLISLSGEAAADVPNIVKIVSGDPALAAEILFLANSSLFCFPTKIQTLRHAVAVLGVDCIRQLAMTVAIRTLARGTGSMVRSCWRHSMACAVIAEAAAPIVGCTPEQAYAAGLLHDVGRLGFLRTYPSEVTSVLGGEYANAAEVIAAERAIIKFSHEDAGAWLMEYWTLPETFAETCQHHHDEITEADSPMLRAVKFACRLANTMGYTAPKYKGRLTFNAVLDANLPQNTPTPFPTEAAMRSDIEARLQAFDPSRRSVPATAMPEYRRIA